MPDYPSLGSAAIACASIEIRKHKSAPSREFATDASKVQKSTYKELGFHESKGCFEDANGKEYSADRMTNFGYTLKIAKNFLENHYKTDAKDLAKLAAKSYGGTTKPYYKSFFTEGYVWLNGKAVRHSEKGELLSKINGLLEEINKFARNSSTLGNYCCIPKELSGLGLSGLNNIKGGCSTSFFVYDDHRNPFRTNDQFALFLAWLEENKKDRDDDVLDAWKEAMLLTEDVVEHYKEATRSYMRAFTAEDEGTRIEQFTDYLENVNNAIELRSKHIVGLKSNSG